MTLQEKFGKIMKNELVLSSMTLLVLMLLGNILNYIFQFSMAVMLGPADYGILAVLTSFIYLFTVPTNAIQTVMSKYTTRFNIKKEYGKIRGLMDYLIKKAFLASIFVFLGYLAAAFILSKSLDI